MERTIEMRSATDPKYRRNTAVATAVDEQNQTREGEGGFLNSKKRLARIAGLLYLIVAIAGGWAEGFVRASLVVAGDAAATARNIADSAMLFRLGFVADLVQIPAFLLVGIVLYQLLKPVNQKIAATFLIFNAIGVALQGANLLNHFAALTVATGPAYAAAFGTASADALVLLFMELHAQGFLIAGIFFGGWMLPLGYVVYKSGYFPRVLGILLMVGSLGYVADTFVSSLLPSVGATYGPILFMPAAIAEIAFVLWLLIKGANVPAQDDHIEHGADVSQEEDYSAKAA
ncbi:MAG: DUF4386 domain-containing protein, partial [Chloroflexota bacterium]